MGKYILVSETFDYDNPSYTLNIMKEGEDIYDFTSIYETPKATFDTAEEAVAYCKAHNISYEDNTSTLSVENWVCPPEMEHIPF